MKTESIETTTPDIAAESANLISTVQLFCLDGAEFPLCAFLSLRLHRAF